MTNEDRDMLLSLREQQSALHQALERLTAQLGALESRTGVHALEYILPPVPPEAFLPPVPLEPVELPPIPAAHAELPSLPDLPSIPTAEQPKATAGLDRWAMRFGAVFALVLFALLAGTLDFTFHLDHRLGLLGRFGLIGLGSVVALFIGNRLDRGAGHSIGGRLLLVAGLLGLYVAFLQASVLAATALTPHPILAGDILLVWTFYAIFVAERHQSHTIGIIAIAFGYFSMAMVPVAWFSMGMNLILTAVCASLLLWRGWATLATVGAIGAYLALFHRLIFNSYGDLILDTSRALPFLPPAVYLVGTWLIFTSAIILCTSHTFRGGKRLFFASFNNGAAALLLAFTTYISGYGLVSIGWTLLDTGLVFLIVSRFAGFSAFDPVELMAAYAAQGLALFTAGVVIVFTGITRAFVLLLETLLLGIAGAFAGDRVLITATYAAGFFATVFAIWQIAIYAHHPWLFGLGGAVIMLINAWSSRADIRYSKVARSSTVFSTSCYCLLALALIFAGFSSIFTDASLPVALALVALLLTFSIYQFSIFELPSLAQVLMLAALVLVLFPVETGEEIPGWSMALVAVSTLILLTWWSRQRMTLPGAWIIPVCYLYAFALVYCAVLTIQPYCSAEGWMVTESLLAAAFFLYGAFLRVWPLAIAGQILLVLSLCHVFFPPDPNVYAWSAFAAAVPLAVTYASGRAVHRGLPLFPELSGETRAAASFVAYVYKLIALLGVIRLIFALAPASEHLGFFFILGALLIALNVRRHDSFGVRCGLLLSALGIILCVSHETRLVTGLNVFAVLLFLAELPLVLSAVPSLITRLEGWALTIAAVFTGWYFVSVWAWPHHHGTHSHLSLAWALFALFLFMAGLISGRARLRWCGLVVLLLTMLRVIFVDLWTLPIGLRVLTVFLLVLILLGTVLGFVLGKTASSENPTRNV
jgi:hypothetical protein